MDCYDDVAVVRGKVIDWFEDKLNHKKIGLEKAVCGYNTGNFEVGDCVYYQRFVSM